MSNSAEVATAGEGKSSSLSDAELSAFWDGIVANGDAARAMAAQFVSRHSVDDVVHTAAINFLESLEPRKKRRFPKTNDEFRRRFLVAVRNHAIDCVRGVRVSKNKRPNPLVHSHWGVVTEPVVGGSKTGDRRLDRVFARNDDGKYDAPAPTELRAQDTIDQLDYLLRSCVDDLPPMQQKVIQQTFFEKRKRAEVARRLGKSESTYDNHLQAAFRSLRDQLEQVVELFTDIDRSLWYDFIEDLCERYEASVLRRASVKKGKRSNLKGKRSNLEGKASNLEGERSNSDGEEGKDSRAGAA